MARTIRDRLEKAEDGTLMLQVSPSEWLQLADIVGDVPLYYTGAVPDEENTDRAFSYQGIIVYCTDVHGLWELQKVRAIASLETIFGTV